MIRQSRQIFLPLLPSIALPAAAQTLTVAIDVEPPTLDPHARMLAPDEAVSPTFSTP